MMKDRFGNIIREGDFFVHAYRDSQESILEVYRFIKSEQLLRWGEPYTIVIAKNMAKNKNTKLFDTEDFIKISPLYLPITYLE